MGVVGVLVMAAVVLLTGPTVDDAVVPTEVAAAVVTPTAVPTPTTIPTPSPTPGPTPVVALAADGMTAAERNLELVATVATDSIRPKSIVGSGDGLFFAQNIMYRHTVTVYDSTAQLLASIPDTVVLSDYGHSDYEGSFQGAPVEAAFTSDGRYGFVSNYQMFGPGFANPGHDACGAGPWDESFVYRIDTDTFQIDQVITAGAVPKFMAITPDDRYLLVSNWCSYDLTVIDIAAGTEVTRIPIGIWPRGIEVSADGSTAYVTVMGDETIAVVDLGTLSTTQYFSVGLNPRHLALDEPAGLLYVSLNGEGRVVKVDLASRQVLGGVVTGEHPRTMVLADDGTALYVVNNQSNTLAKVRTSDMEVLETIDVGIEPIGIYYDAPLRQVWVANYTGSIMVFADS